MKRGIVGRHPRLVKGGFAIIIVDTLLYLLRVIDIHGVGETVVGFANCPPIPKIRFKLWLPARERGFERACGNVHLTKRLPWKRLPFTSRMTLTLIPVASSQYFLACFSDLFLHPFCLLAPSSEHLLLVGKVVPSLLEEVP